MADIKIERDSKLIKVLAAQARKERLDSDVVAEATNIIKELAQDMNPQNRHEIAQTVAFTVDELQSKELDFLNKIADIKNVGYGDKAAFDVKTGGIKAYIQAKGSTTARSMVADRQITVDTLEISARPAINIVDLRTGRVNMGDLIREANREITNKKLTYVEKVLHDSMKTFSSPFYATGNGVIKATLDAQLNYFRRLGPVTILGDIAAVGQVSPLAGFAAGNNQTQFSNNIIDEHNENGFIGRYNGCDVMAMVNGYEEGSTQPILNANWLYLVPAGMSGSARNLKLVNEGPVSSMDAQSIDDVTYEIRLDQWFGAAFALGKQPNIGGYMIG